VSEQDAAADPTGAHWALDDLEPGATNRADRTVRWVFVAFVVVALAAAALGLTGPIRAEARASAGGFTATVTYDRVTRPGLAVSWRLTITSTDGQPLPAVEVVVPNDYFDLFDENGLTPVPDAERAADADHTVWEFDPQESPSLTIVFDARVQPGWHRPEDGDTTVVVDGTTLELEHRTWVLP
jgi:hypothetical protein